MPRFNRFAKSDIDFKYLLHNFYVSDWFAFFVASGDEVCHAHFLNEGKSRIDGKLIVGELENNGTMEINGTVETDPLFEDLE